MLRAFCFTARRNRASWLRVEQNFRKMDKPRLSRPRRKLSFVEVRFCLLTRKDCAEFLTCDQDPSKHLRSLSYLVGIFCILRRDVILSVIRYWKQEAPRVARYSRPTRSSRCWSESSYVFLLRLTWITIDINRGQRYLLFARI